jgi:uroporphyrinogen-III synthase
MRVAVFRAAADGARTAARLMERGHDAVLAPVIRIERTSAPVEAGDAQALLFTSAHAPAVLAHDAALGGLQVLPCWCVGARTASAARELGFEVVDVGPGDAGQLASVLTARLRPQTRLLLLAGRDRKPTLEARLAAAGLALRVTEVYDAAALPAWNESSVAELRGCEAALHYSRRSAALAARLAETHGLSDRMRGWAHHCLSPDVAEALLELGLRCACAPVPTETSLLNGLDAAISPTRSKGLV